MKRSSTVFEEGEWSKQNWITLRCKYVEYQSTCRKITSKTIITWLYYPLTKLFFEWVLSAVEMSDKLRWWHLTWKKNLELSSINGSWLVSVLSLFSQFAVPTKCEIKWSVALHSNVSSDVTLDCCLFITLMICLHVKV